MSKFPLNEKNRIEPAYANGINYTYEYLPDGWIAIWERAYGAYKPIIQACNKLKADEFICLREPAPVGLAKLV